MRTISVVLAVATLTSCGGREPGGEPNADELVLRGYAAPGASKELTEALRRLLSIGDRRVGEVREGPGEQVLLLAPRSVHEGFESVIRTAAEAGSAADPPSVMVTYWFIAARPVSGGERGPGTGLGEVQPALEGIESVEGPQEFRLIDRMQVRQLPDGGSSRAHSARFDLSQRIAVSGGDVVATIRTVADPRGDYRMETVLKLRSGQVVVLGQTGLDHALDPFPREGDPDDRRSLDRSLFLVIRADVDPPA